MPVWINFALFQLGWFGVVLSGAAEEPGLATGIAGAVLIVHLFAARRPVPELKLALMAGALGLLLDSLLTGLGLLRFASGQWVAWAAPLWIVAMWMMFSTTLNSSLGWMKGRFGLAALLGALAGPLAYFGGAKLGAVGLHDTLAFSLLGIALAWLIAMPLLVWLAEHFDGLSAKRDEALADPNPH